MRLLEPLERQPGVEEALEEAAERQMDGADACADAVRGDAGRVGVAA